MSQILGRKGMAYAALGASHAFAARKLLISEGATSLSAGTETLYIIIVVVLIIVSGLAAGLTLGLLSLDRYALSYKYIFYDDDLISSIEEKDVLTYSYFVSSAGLIWNS
jgi:hypothetical protein